MLFETFGIEQMTSLLLDRIDTLGIISVMKLHVMLLTVAINKIYNNHGNIEKTVVYQVQISISRKMNITITL